MNINFILLLISLIFLILGIIIFYKANKIKIQKNQEQQKYKKQLAQQVHTLQVDRNNLINSEIKKKDQLHKQFIDFQEYIDKKKQQTNKKLFEWKKERYDEIQSDLENQKQINKQKIFQAQEKASQEIEEIHIDLQKIRQSAAEEKQKLNKQLDSIRNSLSAGVQARLRDQERKKDKQFYKLNPTKNDLEDIQKLQNLKISFHKPVVLSKLIWSQYFQKQMTELCNKVLGKKEVCGIYKITNINSQQCYIGQSVNRYWRMKNFSQQLLGVIY